MRVLAAVVPTLLAGCSQVEAWRHPEVAACEDYIGALLNAPSTYKRAKVYVSDSKLPLSYWSDVTQELMGRNAAGFADLDKRRADNGGLRSVTIQYDAANGFGVPTRGVSNCKFEMTSFADGDFANEPSPLNAQIEVAGIKSGDVEAAAAAGCCESKRTMKRLRRYEPDARFVSQQVLN